MRKGGREQGAGGRITKIAECGIKKGKKLKKILLSVITRSNNMFTF
jgi:hypothetical protein